MSDYTVTIRGPLPSDLAQRIAEAHAAALKAANEKPTNAVIAPVGTGGKPNEAGRPH